MKIDEEPVDEVRDALIAFFDRQEGGHTEVARAMGVNPQHLYYIITGRNAPTLKTVMRILRHYPDEVELRRAMSLPILARMEDASSPVTPAEPVVAVEKDFAQEHIFAEFDLVRAERDMYKSLVEKREIRIEKLEAQLDTANQTMADLAKSNFPESGSQTTDLSSHYHPQERLVVQGFQLPKGPLSILENIGCTLDADGVWGVPFTPMDIVVRV